MPPTTGTPEEPPEPRFPLTAALDRLRDRKSAVVFMHDNPDPDALASALGLKLLLEHELHVTVTLALGGIVGRAENRAMIDVLQVSLTPVEQLDMSRFDIVAVVDSQPETGNNSLPLGHRVDIVIDHHPARAESGRAAWADVRPDMGATSTILFEYLTQLGIPIDSHLATAFFFALRAETRDLGRDSTSAEKHAYVSLVPLVNHELLAHMIHPKVHREHFGALDRALRAALVYDDIVAVNMHSLRYPDLVAEVADLLLSSEGMHFVLCMGRYAGTAYLSLRTESNEARAGAIMRTVVGKEGAAGGHGTMAGARLFEPVRSNQALQAAFNRIVARLCTHLNRDGSSPVPFLRT